MIFTPYAVPVFVAASLYLGLAIYSLRQRTVPAAVPFGLALLVASVWAWTYALDLSLAGVGDKVFLTKPRFAVIALLVVCWLVMAFEHSGRGYWVNRRRLGLLLVVPAITTLLAFTMEQHQLIRYDFEVRAVGPLIVLVSKFGPWYWVHTAFAWAMILAATVVLFRSTRHASVIYRRQTWLVILAGFLPLLANVVFNSPFNPFPGFDTSTTIFVLTGSMCAYALFQHRFLDLAPVARAKVFEAIQDIVIVLDMGYRVVDVNPAARHLLGAHYFRVVGKEFRRVFKGWPELVATCLASGPGASQLYLRRGVRRRCYEVHTLPLSNRNGLNIGRLITLRDATERVQAQAQELEKERVRALLESRDRLARDIAEVLHGPVQTKLLVAWQRLYDCQDLIRTDPEKAANVLQDTREMIDHVREHEVREASHRLHPAMISVGLAPALDSLVSGLKGSLRISVNIAPEVQRMDAPTAHCIPLPVTLAAYHILDEGLANVCRHARAQTVKISVCLDSLGRLDITLEDDGCGFDLTESKSGLGLAIIGGRAEQVGGTWQVSSAVGGGTTVRATLPLKSSCPAG